MARNHRLGVRKENEMKRFQNPLGLPSSYGNSKLITNELLIIESPNAYPYLEIKVEAAKILRLHSFEFSGTASIGNRTDIVMIFSRMFSFLEL
jgi:hypothetical protein